MLGRREAEAGDVGYDADLAVADLGPEGQTRILNDEKTVPVGQPAQGMKIGRVSIHVDRQDGARAWRDRRLGQCYVDIARCRVDINPHYVCTDEAYRG